MLMYILYIEHELLECKSIILVDIQSITMNNCIVI